MAPRGADAHEVALRALARREYSECELRGRLRRTGFGADEVEEAVAAVLRDGLLSDERFAVERARVLAERGRGDAAIRLELDRAGLTRTAIEAALDALEPERERAERLISRRGASAATARLLASRGFDEDVVAAAVAHEA